jgi:hypothetical protein
VSNNNKMALTTDIRPTSGNTHTKEAQIWTPQKGNNANGEGILF